MATALTMLNQRDRGQARSQKGRVLTALALTGLATFVVVALCLAKREVEYRAAVVVRAERAGGWPGRSGSALSATDAAHAARQAFAEAGGSPSDVLAAVLLTDGGPSRPAFRIEARWRERDGVVERLNACGRSLANRWNASDAEASAKNVANCREVVRDARRRRDEMAAKVRQLNAAGHSGGTQEETAHGVSSGAQPPASGVLAAAGDKVRQLRDELARRRQRFTDEHPEVQHAVLELAEAEAQLAAASPSTPTEAPEDAVNVAPPANSAAVDRAVSDLAAADRQFEATLAAEASAARRHAEVLANPSWRVEAANEATHAYIGDANVPWGSAAGWSLFAGLAAALLARGLRPTVDSPDDAVATLGIPVVGTVAYEGPALPLPVDHGVATARWLARAAAVALIVAFGVTLLAASQSAAPGQRIAADPLSLLTLPREWLASL